MKIEVLDQNSTILWLMDPTSPIYVRKQTYSLTRQEAGSSGVPNKQFFKRQFGDWSVVGFELPPIEYFLTNEIFYGVLYFLKAHDTFFHPDHPCSAFCHDGLFPVEAVKVVDSEQKHFKVTPEFSRQPLSYNARHTIFLRDSYKCVECGASKSDTVLHIDHILPVSKGGTNDLSNLQTLCRECNRDKGSGVWDG